MGCHWDVSRHESFEAMSKTQPLKGTKAMSYQVQEQARKIVDEYHRRHRATGDAHPWWSLQPGYPDELGYFGGAHRKQGGYANGGLMPWVGGELCRGAFGCGRETYGVELLRQYVDHLRRTGGAHVWYWPNGEPGFRTTNEVPYATWGMAEWLSALVQGLAGIEDETCLMEDVRLSPRWSSAGVKDVRVIARYAASKGYFAYRMRIDEQQKVIEIDYCGSGKQARVECLLPFGWSCGCVQVNGADVEFEERSLEDSRYVCFDVPISGLGRIRIMAK